MPISGPLSRRPFFLKLIESLILAKPDPDSRSPNRLLRMYRASSISRMPRTKTATHPSAIPVICALLSFFESCSVAGALVAPPVGAASAVVDDDDDVVDVASVVERDRVELVVSPEGRVKTGIGAVVVAEIPECARVDVLFPVFVVDGVTTEPVSDEGRIRVASSVLCVLGLDLDTPMHIL